MSDIVIITRHPALVEVLKELAPEVADAKVLAQATAADVAGKHVYGVLPLHLAALAEKVTAVTILTPPELRGVELSVEQVRQYMTKDLATYRVEKL